MTRNISIRMESPADVPAVRGVNERAFGRSLEADPVESNPGYERRRETAPVG